MQKLNKEKTVKQLALLTYNCLTAFICCYTKLLTNSLP